MWNAIFWIIKVLLIHLTTPAQATVEIRGAVTMWNAIFWIIKVLFIHQLIH
jgi:hypothetical protein